ncbi:Eco57I restriction-modification methylase domain-containing protein [Staphylococcus equorum]|uniref:Eco57I restriction-modification methylase domain-containing protein n=1 Tax=Staphylococcus equorum TaxID=246432 RepID=UPI0008537890|nr:Eco57I restriction-modification methylase domain-containing protein [Staphylococcus equorum]MDK9842974.1 Eco57I restriction-modification methylase domain-containing protein [Staphylococcus equorum]OEK61730.1 hypothetical protein ASS99_08890 [Staphylococcus equorum]
MKFDVVVGNPPYQENDNGKRDDGSINASASPLYHYFFDLAESISNERTCLIFPARWIYGSGKGLGNFSTKMLESKNIKSLTLFQASNKVFPNTDIKGGVLFTVFDKNYEGIADITVYDRDNIKQNFNSYLNTAGSGVFIPFKDMIDIFKKVAKQTDFATNSFQSIVSSRKPYGLSTNFFSNPSKYGLPPVKSERISKDDIEIIGLEGAKRVKKYVDSDYPINTGKETINKWKLFSGKAMGSGIFGEKVPDLPIGGPGTIATETFIRIGVFDSKNEAEAVKKYFYTKFFRSLLGLVKTTQDAPARVYKFVPIQDFTINSDIDWSQSIPEIDQQLYAKYGLSQSETNFIEEKVKPMV